MLFVTTFDIIPGKYSDAIKSLKLPSKIPDGIVIKEFLGLFGKPDAIVIYDAPDERTAVEFVMKFSEYAIPRTSVAYPKDAFKWTHT